MNRIIAVIAALLAALAFTVSPASARATYPPCYWHANHCSQVPPWRTTNPCHHSVIVYPYDHCRRLGR